ncbi:hypothetical protein GQX74_010877, partial [Glossina fuscipes]
MYAENCIVRDYGYLSQLSPLKEDIERRGASLTQLLERNLNTENTAFEYFIQMKAKLITDGRDITDKIKKTQELLKALNETLIHHVHNMPNALDRFGDCGSKSSSCFSISASLEFSSVIIGNNSSLLAFTIEGNARVVIKLAELLEGVPTSRRAPGINLKICRMVSTSVIVFPVPGGPKITYGMLKTSPRSIFATVLFCSELSMQLCHPRRRLSNKRFSSSFNLISNCGRSRDCVRRRALRIDTELRSIPHRNMYKKKTVMPTAFNIAYKNERKAVEKPNRMNSTSVGSIELSKAGWNAKFIKYLYKLRFARKSLKLY